MGNGGVRFLGCKNDACKTLFSGALFWNFWLKRKENKSNNMRELCVKTEGFEFGYLRISNIVGSEKNTDDKERSSHIKPLCKALYNSLFNQVVSACHASLVIVWSLDTGEKVIQFSNAHPNSEITAMCFDQSLRRLVTGMHYVAYIVALTCFASVCHHYIPAFKRDGFSQ